MPLLSPGGRRSRRRDRRRRTRRFRPPARLPPRPPPAWRWWVVLVQQGAHLADGVQLGFHEALAAEAGLDGHDQHHIQFLNVGQDGLGTGDGAQGNGLLHAPALHGVQRPADAAGAGGLQMDGDEIGSRVGEVVDIAVGVVDHQMHVQKGVGVLVDCLQHRQTEGDVGHEAAVHHVEVDEVGAGNAVKVCAQTGKIGGEDRGCDLYHTCIVPFSWCGQARAAPAGIGWGAGGDSAVPRSAPGRLPPVSRTRHKAMGGVCRW